MSRVLNLDCCWVQLFTASTNELSLSAYHGFPPLIQEKMAKMDVNHPFAKEIAGIGNMLIIPDISLDGSFDMLLFKEEGFRSVLAVPILTYRVNGILGTAYRTGRRFTKSYSDLLVTIGGLIGMAYDKCVLIKKTNGIREIQTLDKAQLFVSSADEGILKRPGSFDEATVSSQRQQKSETDGGAEAHKKHAQKMRVFRNSHRKV